VQCSVDFRDSCYAYTSLMFIFGRTGELFSHYDEHTGGCMKVMPPIFSPDTIITIIMECTCVLGTCFTK
jgi:hypothetical protein